ncbi:hypothetical protein ILUMI_25726 [Ignelater luminosus]|uniref:Retroviral polymerase SH3-like domain-containing protein n=1 Tax=Ignelater luminosus TaxID=2038154 RepID=A0A8K0C527_IGNLU|nr:hypothetical protein ILUMI_25726 [Ignelater luminosus]
MLTEADAAGYHVKELLSDYGGEFDNNAVQEKGIIQQLQAQTVMHIYFKRIEKKFNAKAIQGILIGYDLDGYRIWCPQKNSLIPSCDVVCNEKPLYFGAGITVPTNTETTKETPQITEDLSDCEERIPDEEDEIDEELEGRRVLRDRNTIKLPQRFHDFVMYRGNNIMADCVEPNNYEEAIQSQHSKEWKQTMDEEMNSLWKNETWNLEKLPVDKKAIPCKFYRAF